MSSLLQPLHLLLMMFAGWVNRHQLNLIDYLQEENRLLEERLGGRRIRFTDAERRRLARKAHVLGRKALNGLDTLVTPDTLLRWHFAPPAERRRFCFCTQRAPESAQQAALARRCSRDGELVGSAGCGEIIDAHALTSPAVAR